MAYSELQIEEKFNFIIEQIENKTPLYKALALPNMPNSETFYRWLEKDPEKSKKYTRATEIRADKIFEEMFDIADDGTNDYMEKIAKDGSAYEVLNAEHVQRSRLRIETRKWALAKLQPKKYGEKIGLEHSGEIGNGNIKLNINFQNFTDNEEIIKKNPITD